MKNVFNLIFETFIIYGHHSLTFFEPNIKVKKIDDNDNDIISTILRNESKNISKTSQLFESNYHNECYNRPPRPKVRTIVKTNSDYHSPFKLEKRARSTSAHRVCHNNQKQQNTTRKSVRSCKYSAKWRSRSEYELYSEINTNNLTDTESISGAKVVSVDIDSDDYEDIDDESQSRICSFV